MNVYVVLSGSVIDGVDTTWPESVWLEERLADLRCQALKERNPYRNRFFQVEEMEVEDAD